MKNKLASTLLLASALATGGALLTAPATDASPKVGAGDSRRPIVAARRLTESQYKHSVADIFGADIQINGRFEPEQREHLLLAIGSASLSISAAGFAQYFAMAKSIADQVLHEERRAKFATCQPADLKNADERCTDEFLRRYGRLLFRRPLTDEEVAPRVAVAAAGAKQNQDYYAGLNLALTSLLTAPQFLFRIERAEPDSQGEGWRLDGYSKAARLSYLLWDATPDEELLQAAASGELHGSAGVQRQIERLLDSPRLQAGARAFFSDMLQLDMYESMTKDPTIFPKFSQAVSDAAKEQTLKTVVDHLLTQNGDYRDLFTTRASFLDRSLASIYQTPFLGGEEWMAHEFPPTSDHSGILTQISLLGVFSHPGRSSPTKRGVAINEMLLCEPTPLPPANVDFSLVNDTENPRLPTVRSRLLAHSEDETCFGCHVKSDPLGLALERFDSLGQSRLLENGEPIDVSAELGGKQFTGAQGLGKVLRENPKVTACLVRNVYAYGVGRAPGKNERRYLEEQTAEFAKGGYRLRSLLQQIAGAPEFFDFVMPQDESGAGSKPATTVAEQPSKTLAGA
jgi:Protein of unknown function (DUF1592)/Protein of unknown function (DUF1588)/Protein of unknown function (DUF1595)/Protein of unknown function (DUF1585)/Protein of unknown function (DUF1587)